MVVGCLAGGAVELGLELWVAVAGGALVSVAGGVVVGMETTRGWKGLSVVVAVAGVGDGVEPLEEIEEERDKLLGICGACGTLL